MTISATSSLTPLSRTIVLVGMMGVGKTTVGRRLASRLGASFCDSDEEIEAAAGMSVSEIFALHGEPAFRDVERKVIARLIDGPPCVLATGGGAFVEDETRALIRERAWSVWMKADIELLLKRATRRNTRPLLRDGDPREILTALLAKREPFYAEANVTVESLEGPHQRTVETIVDALRDHITNETA